MNLRKTYGKIIMWIMKRKLYFFFLRRVVPFIRFSMSYTKLKGWQYHKLYSILEPGDIIVTIDRKKLTSLLIPGEFSHAAMCVSKDGIWEVSEMTHTDYTKSCFFDICKESDRVVILGLKDATPSEQGGAIAVCKSLQQVKYDMRFLLGIEALYCSELCLVCWGNEKLKADTSDFAGIGQPYVTPTDLYEAEGVYVKADTRLLEDPRKDQGVILG